jgi:hypothetical protein
MNEADDAGEEDDDSAEIDWFNEDDTVFPLPLPSPSSPPGCCCCTIQHRSNPPASTGRSAWFK